jgi:iron-sulfur cluster repair protein YtfE (RIC family)
LQLDPALTINEIVAAHPATIPVFDRFGFDTGCGGGVRVDEVAKRDGIEVGAMTGMPRRMTDVTLALAG